MSRSGPPTSVMGRVLQSVADSNDRLRGVITIEADLSGHRKLGGTSQDLHTVSRHNEGDAGLHPYITDRQDTGKENWTGLKIQINTKWFRPTVVVAASPDTLKTQSYTVAYEVGQTLTSKGKAFLLSFGQNSSWVSYS